LHSSSNGAHRVHSLHTSHHHLGLLGVGKLLLSRLELLRLEVLRVTHLVDSVHLLLLSSELLVLLLITSELTHRVLLVGAELAHRVLLAHLAHRVLLPHLAHEVLLLLLSAHSSSVLGHASLHALHIGSHVEVVRLLHVWLLHSLLLSLEAAHLPLAAHLSLTAHHPVGKLLLLLYQTWLEPARILAGLLGLSSEFSDRSVQEASTLALPALHRHLLVSDG